MFHPFHSLQLDANTIRKTRHECQLHYLLLPFVTQSHLVTVVRFHKLVLQTSFNLLYAANCESVNASISLSLIFKILLLSVICISEDIPLAPPLNIKVQMMITFNLCSLGQQLYFI